MTNQNKLLRWVKASERLPEQEGRYNCKRLGEPAIAYMQLMGEKPMLTDGNKHVIKNFASQYEWLEEYEQPDIKPVYNEDADTFGIIQEGKKENPYPLPLVSDEDIEKMALAKYPRQVQSIMGAREEGFIEGAKSVLSLGAVKSECYNSHDKELRYGLRSRAVYLEGIGTNDKMPTPVRMVAVGIVKDMFRLLDTTIGAMELMYRRENEPPQPQQD